MSTLVSRPTGRFRDELQALGNAFSRAFERLVQNRQEKADAYVQIYLARLSDSELREIGYSAPEIAKIKKSAGKELPYQL